MSTKEKSYLAYNKTLSEINNYIYKKSISKTKIANDYGISRQTVTDYLKDKIKMPYMFVLYMQEMMKEDPLH